MEDMEGGGKLLELQVIHLQYISRLLFRSVTGSC